MGFTAEQRDPSQNLVPVPKGTYAGGGHWPHLAWARPSPSRVDGFSLGNDKDPKCKGKSEPGSEVLSLSTIHLHQPCMQHLKYQQPCCLIRPGIKLPLTGTPEPTAELS